MNEEVFVAEKEIEKLDQEITLRLQTIDSNFSYCFKKITQDIIPHVREYSDICDRIIDNTSILTTLFQESGNLTLGNNSTEPTTIAAAAAAAATATVSNKVKEIPTESRNTANNTRINGNEIDITQDFHTANITSTGQVLRLPDSSDEEDNNEERLNKRPNYEQTNTNFQANITRNDGLTNDSLTTENHDDSTIQRQSRKRKVSLLLQQEYGSSSSALPSPVAKYQKPITNPSTASSSNNNNNKISTNSSPLKVLPHTKSNTNDSDDNTNDLLNIDTSLSSSQ
ncbi:DASH complex subunit ask1 [Maudiozyma exigua]|uniref:DASH complex subunit ASK1 n=1 Tax=Maudiozyma exigua TaxID=34358 RepID=A0A9P6WBM1_MAUEX|nr:DASH complex subunit ask1 [Kazachstania exigua]